MEDLGRDEAFYTLDDALDREVSWRTLQAVVSKRQGVRSPSRARIIAN